MKAFLYKLYKNLLRSFTGRNFFYHLLAIISTYFFVNSGFDWLYYKFFHGSIIYYIMFSAAAVGGLFPILLPATMLLFGKLRKSDEFFNVAYALIQAAVLGSFVSSIYKAFTGRAHPSLISQNLIDITHNFQFGFLRGGIFWGWPSSHTTIAFAMALTMWTMYSNKIIRSSAILYAFYIGIGVSMTIHWFSDFTAGAILGSVIGIVVGNSFKKKVESIESLDRSLSQS